MANMSNFSSNIFPSTPWFFRKGEQMMSSAQVLRMMSSAQVWG
jgi:hypothetical protein